MISRILLHFSFRLYCFKHRKVCLSLTSRWQLLPQMIKRHLDCRPFFLFFSLGQVKDSECSSALIGCEKFNIKRRENACRKNCSIKRTRNIHSVLLWIFEWKSLTFIGFAHYKRTSRQLHFRWWSCRWEHHIGYTSRGLSDVFLWNFQFSRMFVRLRSGSAVTFNGLYPENARFLQTRSRNENPLFRDRVRP